VAFLRELLADTAVQATEVKAEAKTQGIALRTLDRAKRKAGVRAYRDGSVWWWAITPYTAAKSANTAHDGALEAGAKTTGRDESGTKDAIPSHVGVLGVLEERFDSAGISVKNANDALIRTDGALDSLPRSEGDEVVL